MKNLPRLLLSTLRITLGVLLGLFVVGLALGAAIRQPTFGSLAVPAGERASPERLEAIVRFLCEEAAPRNVDHPENLERAALHIEDAFRAAGGLVRRQEYVLRGETFTNVVASFGPATGPRYVVGAHYDAFSRDAFSRDAFSRDPSDENPGADDNASGTAGVVELARLLGARRDLPVGVEVVAFSTEEPPYFGGSQMGSAVFAEALAAEGVSVLGMINLEMIGYFSGRQRWPHLLFTLLYPEDGDFVGVVGRWQDRGLVRHLSRAYKGAGGIEAYAFAGPRNAGLDASEHISFWDRGFPAVMVTDTASLRNPHYHEPSDTPETLDYVRMAQVVDGVLAAVTEEP